MLNLVHLHSYQKIDIALVQAVHQNLRGWGQALIWPLDFGRGTLPTPSCALRCFPQKFPGPPWAPGPAGAVRAIPWGAWSSDWVPTELTDLCL